jgi:hypothetical protein
MGWLAFEAQDAPGMAFLRKSIRAAGWDTNAGIANEWSYDPCFIRDYPWLVPDDLDQHPLTAATVEFTIEDLLPRAEVELSLGDGYDGFPSHDLPFQVSVCVVFAGPVV